MPQYSIGGVTIHTTGLADLWKLALFPPVKDGIEALVSDHQVIFHDITEIEIGIIVGVPAGTTMEGAVRVNRNFIQELAWPFLNLREFRLDAHVSGEHILGDLSVPGIDFGHGAQFRDQFLGLGHVGHCQLFLHGDIAAEPQVNDFGMFSFPVEPEKSQNVLPGLLIVFRAIDAFVNFLAKARK